MEVEVLESVLQFGKSGKKEKNQKENHKAGRQSGKLGYQLDKSWHFKEEAAVNRQT